MRDIYLILLSIIIFTTCSAPAKQEKDSKTVNLILDTDIGFGFDDVGAIAMLHALADRSEVAIRAILTSNQYELSVPCIDIINTWFGRPGIPVGATKNANAAIVFPEGDIKWTEELVAKYPHRLKSNNEAPDAVNVYRKALSNAENKSITICTIGFLTNLHDLLLSAADEYSPLSGYELIEQKVKLLVCMGGSFPVGREFNLFKDIGASTAVIDQWPTDILFSGSEIGSAVITGKSIPELQVTNNPVKDAYETASSQSNHFMGESWDQTAILVAIKGWKPYYNIERGACMMAKDGKNTWKADKAGKHLRLIPDMPPEKVAEVIERYMTHLPVK